MAVGSIHLPFPRQFHLPISPINMNPRKPGHGWGPISCSSSESVISSTNSNAALPFSTIKRRKRNRRKYPGETKGLTEEMRFVAMRLRNINGKKCRPGDESGSDNEDSDEEKAEGEGEDSAEESLEEGNEGFENGEIGSWKPSMEGFLKYLVNSKLVFDTVERIVDESDDVSYAYFRRTGLERSGALLRDLEWFRQQDIAIPKPSNPGLSYVKYLKELANRSPPLFLAHFYNIYFAHIAGGEVIAKQALEKLLEENTELEFFSWEGNVQESFKAVREKLNMLAEYWSRDDKARCLRETAKSFKYTGQIVRLLIL